MQDYIGDDLVTFETALLLEKAGYSEECIYTCSYKADGSHSEPAQGGGVKKKGIRLPSVKTVLIPTQTAAMKWIRETAFPYMHIVHTSLGWEGTCYSLADDSTEKPIVFDSYEECAECAIAECAKCIARAK